MTEFLEPKNGNAGKVVDYATLHEEPNFCPLPCATCLTVTNAWAFKYPTLLLFTRKQE